MKCLLYLPNVPGDTVQTGTGKVDPAQKFKCITTARVKNVSALVNLDLQQRK